MAKYVPSNVNFTFNFTVRYTPPDGNKLGFNFQEDTVTPPTTVKQYVFPNTIPPIDISEPNIRQGYRKTFAEGFDSLEMGESSIRNKREFVETYDNLFEEFGYPFVENGIPSVTPESIFEGDFGSPDIYNLLQYVDLDENGLASELFGDSLLKGGVRYVYAGDLDFTEFGDTKFVNTKADQYIDVTGGDFSKIGDTNVSPQIVSARGILGTLWGTPYVQRNPNPSGWISERFGTAWVSRSPRYFDVSVGNTSDFGLAKIFDARQDITVYTVIDGGIFGDIRIYNLNYIIKPLGFVSDPPVDWTVVENTKRPYSLKGFDAALFGSAWIRNATASFTPDPLHSLIFGEHLIADRIRRINVPGIYQHVFGLATATKTPELNVDPFDALGMGDPVVSNYVRYIEAHGFESLEIEAIDSVTMLRRQLVTQGFLHDEYGEPSISHAIRELIAQGFDALALDAEHQLWFRVRSIEVKGIYEDQKAYSHRVGGTQYVQSYGFDATLFGDRIIPENRHVLAESFKSSVFGDPQAALSLQYVKPIGFITVGLEAADRWGNTRVYNLRQYITQYYDVDSELNPPKWSMWQAVENRNKQVVTVGTEMSRLGRAQIDNNAHLFLPSAIDSEIFGLPFVSHKNRKIGLEGIEPEYISSWGVIFNAAKVIKPTSFLSTVFEKPTVYSNRRYFPWIGNFETQAFGTPMISDRIRTLSFEQRYSIDQPQMPLPTVHLYTRYIEAQSKDQALFGLASLAIHKKIIAPQWTLRHYFGDAMLQNKTPQIYLWGTDSSEFGHASIRTQWRELLFKGDEAMLLGNASIAFRNRSVNLTSGITPGAVSTKHLVTGSATPPLMPQYIYLNDVGNSDDSEFPEEIKDGLGIAAPEHQVSEPTLYQNIIEPYGFNALKFGESDIHSNGIIVKDGIKLKYECGSPSVALKNRTISVAGISNPILIGKPQMSPLTIWAVVEAPDQAKENHTVGSLHYVNSDSGGREPGEVFGRATISMHRPYLDAFSIAPANLYGNATVDHLLRYLRPGGIQAYRMGWHTIGDGTQEIKPYLPINFATFGIAGVQLKDELNRLITVDSDDYLSFGDTDVANFNRELLPEGIDSLEMGSSWDGTIYLPQSLNIGFPTPVIPVGNLMESFGKTYISLKVRDIGTQGFDASVIGYDPRNFNARMRVQRGQGGTNTKPVQTIQAVGFDAFLSNASNVKYAVHYIRPDGNSEQFRKGAF